MTLQDQKRQFMNVLGQLEKADKRLVDCVKRFRDQVHAAKSKGKLAKIDKTASDEINRILNES